MFKVGSQKTIVASYILKSQHKNFLLESSPNPLFCFAYFAHCTERVFLQSNSRVLGQLHITDKSNTQIQVFHLLQLHFINPAATLIWVPISETNSHVDLSYLLLTFLNIVFRLTVWLIHHSYFYLFHLIIIFTIKTINISLMGILLSPK